MMQEDRRQFLIEKWKDTYHKMSVVNKEGLFNIRVPVDSHINLHKYTYFIFKEVKELIEVFVKTLSPFSVNQVFDAIYFDILSENSFVIFMKIKEERFPLVVGRKYNNIYALKRLISNISGKYNYYFKFKNTIILVDPATKLY